MSPRPPMLFLETFAQVRRCLTGVVDETYGCLGLGATQAKLLRRIGERRQVSQADLARATRTDPALVGRALQTLLDRGWVQRRRSREDRRAFSLELTASGEVLLREVLVAREVLAQRVRACLTEADLVAFGQLARKLLEAFPEKPAEVDHALKSVVPPRSGAKGSSGQRLRPTRPRRRAP